MMHEHTMQITTVHWSRSLREVLAGSSVARCTAGQSSLVLRRGLLGGVDGRDCAHRYTITWVQQNTHRDNRGSERKEDRWTVPDAVLVIVRETSASHDMRAPDLLRYLSTSRRRTTDTHSRLNDDKSTWSASVTSSAERGHGLGSNALRATRPDPPCDPQSSISSLPSHSLGPVVKSLILPVPPGPLPSPPDPPPLLPPPPGPH